MPPKLRIRDIAGLCQSRPPSAVCKLYEGLVQGQAYLKISALVEISVLKCSGLPQQCRNRLGAVVGRWLVESRLRASAHFSGYRVNQALTIETGL